MPIVERYSVAVELDFVLSGLIAVPLLANGSGDANHRGLEISVAWGEGFVSTTRRYGVSLPRLS
jgi:hypothetical protein